MFYEDRAHIIGDRIKANRKRLKLTQKELLERVYLSEKSVASLRKWENGERLPDLDTIARMAEVFNCDIGHLLGDYDENDFSTHRIHEITGLSEPAINRLTGNPQGDMMKWISSVPELSSLLTSDNFWAILNELSLYRHHCRVEKNRPALIEKAKKSADNAIEQYENAKHGESADKIEQYRETAKNEIETVQRHKKDLDFSRKDKEIVWANLFKRFISIVNQIEEDVKNG